MRRPKLFLGITASLLAVVGLAATKTNWHTVTPFYTVTGVSGQVCLPYDATVQSTVTSGSAILSVQTSTGTNHRAFYSKNALTSKCQKPLFIGD